MTDAPIENKDDNLENLISQSLEQTNNEPDNTSTNTNENKYSAMIGKIIKFNHQIIDNMIKSVSDKLDVKTMTDDDKTLMKALLRTSLFYSENAKNFIKKIDNEVK